jgi:diacylglycerol kinase (ATP)
MRYAFVLNPAAENGRAGRRRAALEAVLHAEGVACTLSETEAPGHATALAREAAAEADVVVAVGGDGTIQEVACGVYGTGTLLGVLPLGTGNDFAHAVGMPDDLGAAVRALLQAQPRAVDLGRVRWTEHGDDDALDAREALFTNCLGVGFDALVARNVHRFKALGGRAAYHAAVFRTLWSWRQPEVEIGLSMEETADGERTTDHEPRTTEVRPQATASVQAAPSVVRRPSSVVPLHDGRFFLVEIGNGFSVGGGFLLTPDARVDDGLLDVCLIDRTSTRRIVRLLPTAFTGDHVHAPEVTMREARRVTIRSASPLPVQADGEVLTVNARALDVAVLPGALRVLAPHLRRP